MPPQLSKGPGSSGPPRPGQGQPREDATPEGLRGCTHLGGRCLALPQTSRPRLPGGNSNPAEPWQPRGARGEAGLTAGSGLPQTAPRPGPSRAPPLHGSPSSARPPPRLRPFHWSPPLSPLPGHPSAVPAWWRPREPRVSAPGGRAGKRGHAWPGHHSRRGGGADWAAAPRCAQPSPRARRPQHERGLGAPGGGAPRSDACAPRLQGGAAAQLPAPAGPRPAHQVRPQRGAAAAAVPEPVGAGRGGGGRGPCRC